MISITQLIDYEEQNPEELRKKYIKNLNDYFKVQQFLSGYSADKQTISPLLIKHIEFLMADLERIRTTAAWHNIRLIEE